MQNRIVPGLHALREGEEGRLEAETPLILIVVRGVLRVRIDGKQMELGPCTMLYLPGGSAAELTAAWGDVQLYLLESFPIGEEPRILYNGYGVKSPNGEAALCIRIDEKGVRVLTKARVYPTLDAKLQAVSDSGEAKLLNDGAEVEPPARIVAERRMNALLILKA